MALSTYISLFSGAAGLDLGLRIALPEARCVCYCERDGSPAEILATRIEEGTLDEAPIWSDVRTFPRRLYRGRVAGIIGGFPCQDLSVAGKRAGIDGAKSGLWAEYARIIGDVRPDWVLIENVSGLLDNEPLRRVLGDLSGLGFNAEWLSIRASDVGASHGRKRVFILAYRASDNGRRGIVGAQAGVGENGIGRRGPASGCGIVADAESIGSGSPWTADGRERSGHAWHDGEHLADPGNGQLQEPRRGPEGRDGAGSAEPVLGDSRGPGLEIGRCVPGNAGEECAATERTGDLLDDSPRTGEPRLNRESGRSGRRGVRKASESLEHAEHRGSQDGRPESRGTLRNGGDEDQRSAFADAGSILGLFAPGPSDPRWQDVLVQYPWLRPSLSQAEAESHLRDVADGLADLVVDGRTAALRCLGNGVVPLQAAAAFRELVRRITALSDR